MGCKTHGLVITARCDVAQDKVKTYNYLPVVSLNDWLHNDGLVILGEQLRNEAQGEMEACIKKIGYSASILNTETPASVLQTLYSSDDPKSKESRERPNFEKHLHRLELANDVLRGPSASLRRQFFGELAKAKNALIKNLTAHKVNGYYFLEQVDPDGDSEGYVVLIREIQSLPRALAHEIAQGIDRQMYAQLSNADPKLQGKLDIPADEYALPIGLLSSPNLEHLMQAFSMLFGRIGLRDHEPAYVDILCSANPKFKEADEHDAVHRS